MNASVEVRECLATVLTWDGGRGTVEPHVGPAVALLTAVTVKAGGWLLDQVKVGTILLCRIVIVEAPEYASVVSVLSIVDLACTGGEKKAAAAQPETPDDGGPAYPVPGPTELPSNGIITNAYSGMTLRDRFAIAALPALIKRDGLRAPGYAKWAYEMADAMLAARKGAGQ